MFGLQLATLLQEGRECVCVHPSLSVDKPAAKSPLPLILVHLLCLCHSMCGRSALWSAYVAAMWVGRSTRACLASVCAQGHSRCLRRAATVLYRIVSIIALNAKAMSLFPWGDQVRHCEIMSRYATDVRRCSRNIRDNILPAHRRSRWPPKGQGARRCITPPRNVLHLLGT